MGRQPPVLTLPPAAEPAWRAYCAMLASKDAHFGELRRLDEKRNQGEPRTLAEVAQLGQLLDRHNDCVGEFSRAMRELTITDRAAQAVLVQAITELNSDLGDAGADG